MLAVTNLLMQKIHYLSCPLVSFCMLCTHLNALSKRFVQTSQIPAQLKFLQTILN